MGHDLTDSYLPFWPVGLSEVPKRAIPFVHHLNELHRRSCYFDRVWLRLQWAYPSITGFIRTDELERLEDAGKTDLPIFEAFSFARHRKLVNDFELMRASSDALACVAPDLFDERCEVWGELMTDDDDEWTAPGNINRTRKLSVTGYLFCVEVVHSILAKRELELGMLREGHHLALWKAESQKLGASLGGKRSAETRRAGRRADPAKVLNDVELLIKAGKSKRNVAGIIAARSGVTADHVRKILRDALKGKTEVGS